MEKNILFLMGVYPSYGGVEKVSTILANEFVTRGYKVSIVSFEQPIPELATTELDLSVNLYHLEYPVFSKKNILKLSQIIKEQSINFVINQWCIPFYVTSLLKAATKKTSCKIVAVHHNLPNTNARLKHLELDIAQQKSFSGKLKYFVVKSISRLSLRYVYERSDAFVVLSKSFIPITEHFIAKKEIKKIMAISNPLTVEKSDGNDLKKKQIIYVGRLENNQKRVFRILDIWKDLSMNFTDWSLHLIGDGPDREVLQQYSQKLDLQNVFFEGFRDPLPFYKSASLLLLTSEFEGFGLVIVEGMEHGVIPIVYGSFSAVYDIIESGKSGEIIQPPYLKDNFINKMQELMENERLREEISFQAKLKAKDFALENIIKEWENLFIKLDDGSL